VIRRGVAAAAMFLIPGYAAAWAFDTHSDEMGRGETKIASVRSLNAVKFGFPYAGDQSARLHFRVRPGGAVEALLEIDRGQFNCGSSGCQVAIRLDERKAFSLHAMPPADHQTGVIFISGASQLLDQLRHAKALRLEARFYQDGARVFDFDVADLGAWPKKQSPTPSAKK
jgi:hypothetical protein